MTDYLLLTIIIPLVLFVLFLLYLIFDMRRFDKQLEEKGKEFRNKLLEMIKNRSGYEELDANDMKLVKSDEF